MPPTIRPLLAALLALPLAVPAAAGVTAPTTPSAPAPVAAPTAATAAPEVTASPAAWTEAPFETLADDHRVSEGHVAPAEDRAADAERAARGELIGGTLAHDALRRIRPDTASASVTAPGDARTGGPPFAGSGYDETWVADLDVLLRGDHDGDGFYGSVDLAIDVDTTELEREVYLVIDLIEPDGALTLSHVTRAFTVRGNATSDAYRVEIELLDNHRPDYRDARIEVRDAWRDTLLDTVSAHGHAALAALPLEAEHGYGHGPVDDDVHHPHVADEFAFGILLTGSSSRDDHYHDDESGYAVGYAGGAGPFGALALLGLALGRRRLRRAANRPERSAVRRPGDFL